MKYTWLHFSALLMVCLSFSIPCHAQENKRPNVILIMTDDLGYGDLSCYGATKIKTPGLDRLAAQGLRFTNAHCTSATCTPSRYALMTGQYPWRIGASVLPGDAALIVPTDKISLPKVFKKAGYATGIVGKWHLGLGTATEKNWNNAIAPGPNEVGFDESFIFPATADRVPTVFLEDHFVTGLDTADPIAVKYAHKIGNEPTGKENPELLKMKAQAGHGHDNTIVNGIGRIGFMMGGKTARWTDEELSQTFYEKAQQFIRQHKAQPFFLYYAMTEPHVPRMPATVYKGKSGLGFRGDAILQMDDNISRLLQLLKDEGLDKNTLIIFSSDNGPVVNDGYEDGAEALLNGHTPAGPLRGGKYSGFEGGTRIPFLVSWPGSVKAGSTSAALVSQVDLLASFAQLLHQPLPTGEAGDSENMLDALLGRSATGRASYVTQGGPLGLIKDGWKYIAPRKGPAVMELVNIETANFDAPQLYNLSNDLGEKKNLATQYPQKLKEMAALLKDIYEKKED